MHLGASSPTIMMGADSGSASLTTQPYSSTVRAAEKGKDCRRLRSLARRLWRAPTVCSTRHNIHHAERPPGPILIHPPSTAAGALCVLGAEMSGEVSSRGGMPAAASRAARRHLDIVMELLLRELAACVVW
ncbi:hypothetical protein S7711_11247 [Stachybotrys chartarum IBT 7711]|uniref:Uncharacterized protein n=1 Tax=Stachybotrys chartarum (strain CBS 109288 / IBT 7711) TaxID=1280523 RepID=A0A084AS82_STACB|nr:hypothetical protein S7711_11247 [Stachybotrys chartarum IBT 7711]